MHQVIIDGYDSDAKGKPLTITVCYEDELDGTKTITFEDFDTTLDLKDLKDAIEYLKGR